MKTESKHFYYFENHGNEDGTDNFTIIYGDQEEDYGNGEITGAEDTEEQAIEACKRLNSIVSPILSDREELLKALENLSKANARMAQWIVSNDQSGKAFTGMAEHAESISILSKHRKAN